MEKDINVVTLEDGIEYAIIDEIELEDKKYLYLSNINNDSDICIRKVVTIGDEEFIIGLSDENEFELALTTFTKNHKDLVENL